MRNRTLRIGATLVVTGLCTAYLVWKIDLSRTLHLLAHAKLGYFLAAVAIMIGSVWPMAWRWQQLLHARGIQDRLSWLTRAYFVAYTTGQIQTIGGLRYGTAVNYQGASVDLFLDLYLPPDDGPAERPLAILAHGGGFSGGNRADMAGTARSYAQRGFVAASISYRLRPSASLPDLIAAATDGIDDGMESVRWLRANAATYGIDTERIALVGSSAGGVIALGAATSDDPTPGGPLGDVSPAIAAGVSTGVSLTTGLDTIDMTPSDAPIQMFHYEQDTVALRETWVQAYQTCDAAHAGGVVCDFVRLPGSGHTVSLAAGGPWWSAEIGPFLWHHLSL